MFITIPIAMFGCPLLCLMLFAIMRNRRMAMLLCFTTAWLFLPQAGYMWPGPLKWTKSNAVSVSVVLAVLVFDSQMVLRFRPRWHDIPVLLTIIWPAASAFANGFGIADAGTSSVNSILMYVVPYLLGRIYILDLAGTLDLTRTLVLGGVVYIPLCLYELRMSPLLHYHIYGFFQHEWAQMVRYGGYRPIVFMQHGLAVAMWMNVATVIAFGLWRVIGIRRLWQLPTVVWVIGLAAIAFECKSAGPLCLGVLGCAVLEISRRKSSRLLLCILLFLIPLYISARVSGIVSAGRIVSTLQLAFSPDRTASAADRLNQEDILSGHALQRPVFGWGPWGDYRTTSHGNELLGHVDSMWIITLGKYGLVGLTATILIYLLPGVRLLFRKMKSADSGQAFEKLLLIVSLVPILAMIDNLSNFMPNPLFIIAAGAASTLLDRRMISHGSRTQKAHRSRDDKSAFHMNMLSTNQQLQHRTQMNWQLKSKFPKV